MTEEVKYFPYSEDFIKEAEPEMRTLRVRAVLAYNDKGDFVIHGNNAESPSEMNKAIQPIWTHDPSNENINYIEFDVLVPVITKQIKAQVLG